MKKIYTLVVVLASFYATSFSQQQTALFLESSTPTGVQESFYKQVSERNLVDDHIYVCGATYNNSGTYDILLSKYTLSNVLVWTVTYTSSGNYNDFGTDLTFDTNGEILVVGAVQTSSVNTDCIALKYDDDGTLLWSNTYSGSSAGLDGLSCVVTDASNNVYVSGAVYQGLTSLTDMVLIKYNSSGTQQFANTWNNSTYNLQDASFRILLSGAYVNCYGASQTQANPTVWKLCNAQYLQSNGTLNGSSTSNGDNEDFAEIKDVIIESNYFVTACGYQNVSGQGRNLKVTKFNQTLTSIWNYTYNNASNGNDIANSIELNGSLYVGGSTTLADGSKDFYTCKLNYGNGNMSWENIFDGGSGENDEVIDLATDGTGQLYFCGNSNKVGNSDYYVAKLKNTTGALLASNRWNGAYNLNDVVSNMVVTSTGEIYVAGQEGVTSNTGPTYKYALTKWSEKTVWVPVPSDGYSSSGGYITNKEQLRNEDGSGNETVKFYNQSHRVATYVNDTLVAYQLVQAMDTTDQDTTFRVDMKFTKGSPNAKVFPFSERKEYHNYYLGHMSGASERTAIVNNVLKSGVYTNTDVIYTHSPSGFRHLIVARSGAPTADFEMTFSGQSSLSVDGSGKLVIATSIGNITFTKAKAYTMNSTTGVLTLLGWQPSYSISGSAVSFTSLGSWSGTLVLEFGEVVQSAAISESALGTYWSTFCGGGLVDIFYDVAALSSGATWVCGGTQSSSLLGQVGTTIGQYLTEYDMLVGHFAANAENLWFAYLGSNHLQIASGIDVNGSGDSYIIGTSYGGLLNMQSQYFDASPAGAHDALLVKLNTVGSLIWDGYIGGAADEFGYDLAYNEINGEGELYVIGNSESASDFNISLTGGGYQQVHAGSDEGFILKLSGEEESVLEWFTFFGSDASDILRKCDVLDNNLVIAGNTKSNTYSETECEEPQDGNFPKCHGDNWNLAPTSSESEAFIASFSGSSEDLIWSTFAAPVISINPIQWQTIGLAVRPAGVGNFPASNIYLTGIVDSDNISEFPIVWGPGYNITSPSQDSNHAFYMTWDVSEGQYDLTWSTFLSGQGGEIKIDVSAGPVTNRMVVGGTFVPVILQEESDWCLEPFDDEWPLCNNSSFNYMESDPPITSEQRSFFMVFDVQDAYVWSTQYGSSAGNSINAVLTLDEFLWVVGSGTTWTMFDYDSESPADYLLTDISSSDQLQGTIARVPIHAFGTFGIHEQPLTSTFRAYPNPANTSLTLESSRLIESGTILRIYDGIGKLVYEETSQTAMKSMLLNISSYSSGVYYIALQTTTDLVFLMPFIKE